MSTSCVVFADFESKHVCCLLLVACCLLLLASCCWLLLVFLVRCLFLALCFRVLKTIPQQDNFPIPASSLITFRYHWVPLFQSLDFKSKDTHGWLKMIGSRAPCMGLSEAPPGFILGSNAWTNDSNAFESLVESSADMTFEDRKRRIRAMETLTVTLITIIVSNPGHLDKAFGGLNHLGKGELSSCFYQVITGDVVPSCTSILQHPTRQSSSQTCKCKVALHLSLSML